MHLFVHLQFSHVPPWVTWQVVQALGDDAMWYVHAIIDFFLKKVAGALSFIKTEIEGLQTTSTTLSRTGLAQSKRKKSRVLTSWLRVGRSLNKTRPRNHPHQEGSNPPTKPATTPEQTDK
jgi:hypothetical protein